MRHRPHPEKYIILLHVLVIRGRYVASFLTANTEITDKKSIFVGKMGIFHQICYCE